MSPPAAAAREWTDWRGPGRDGRVAWLPTRLPPRPRVVWRTPLPGKGLGGVAATRDFVLVSGREVNDTTDAYTCFRADTGKEVWKHLNPAIGELDYGNSPRCTPAVHAGRVYVLGAFGQLHCLELATGKVDWEIDIRDDFGARDVRKWGVCGTPLLADGKLVVNPGGKDASLVALDPKTGKPLWKAPGKPAGYGNFIAATLGGVRQVVGFDADSLGGWELATGKRLWRVTAGRRSDFHVPTPIAVGGRLVVAWENNGTYLFRFGKDGKIDPKPEGHYARLAPDTHTPVVTAGRVFGAWNGLHCLDVEKQLAAVWLRREPAFLKYLTLVATDDRVLAVTHAGELVLFDAKADDFRPLGRWKALQDDGVYSHAAFVGTRVYLRGENELVCVDLGP